MSAPVLVIGATGKTGAPVVGGLARRGIDHRAGVRRPAAAADVHFDWDDPSTWLPAADGVETVYLVKPPIDPVPPVRAFFEAAPWIARVVLLSELGREQKPESDPERMVELIAADHGRRATILRPNWFFDNFGPGGGWGPAIRETGAIRLPTGDTPLAWVGVSDVVDVALIALLGEDLGEVDLSGSEPLSVAELAAAITRISGRQVVHDDPSLDEYRAELEGAGAGPMRVAYLMDLVTDAARGTFARTSDDLQDILGWPPQRLDDYLGDHADYWKRS